MKRPGNDIKRRWDLVVAVGVMCLCWVGLGGLAWAGDCGTIKRPSRRANCTCRPKTQKMALKRAYRGARAACVRALVKKGKAACRKQSASARFRWKVQRTSGPRCAIMGLCQVKRRKMRKFVLGRRAQTKRGRWTHRFRRYTRRVNSCKRGAKVAQKQFCSRTPRRHPLRFKWKKIKKRIRYFMGYQTGYCQIAWRCRYKPRQLSLWCANRP